MLNKTFIIPLKTNIKLLFILKFKFLILDTLNSSKYIFIPKQVKINKIKTKIQILISNNSNYIIQSQWLKVLLDQIYTLKKKYFKTILIRGVGLKISFLEANPRILQLKLGFSHLIFLSIPKNIQVLILKRKIIIQGYEVSIVGNFSAKITNFKKINIFTGKGLWLKNIQKFYCKPVKKR